MGVDPIVVKEHLDAAEQAETSDAKGKSYEELAVYLFEQVPGCIVERDVIGLLRSEQIDVAVGNGEFPDGLPLLPKVFLVECKDWDRRVDSSTVGYFVNILASRGVEVGVLIAAEGITGNPQDFTNAHALGIAAASRGIKVLVVTSEDIASLSTTDDLIDLLTRHLLRAVATGGVGFPD